MEKANDDTTTMEGFKYGGEELVEQLRAVGTYAATGA
jgi:hypothetical protein